MRCSCSSPVAAARNRAARSRAVPWPSSRCEAPAEHDFARETASGRAQPLTPLVQRPAARCRTARVGSVLLIAGPEGAGAGHPDPPRRARPHHAGPPAAGATPIAERDERIRCTRLTVRRHALHDAALLMSREGVRHVPITDERAGRRHRLRARPVRVASVCRSSMAAPRWRAGRWPASVDCTAPGRGGHPSLREPAARTRRAGARQLTELISHLNDLPHRARLVAAAWHRRHGLDLGRAPAGWPSAPRGAKNRPSPPTRTTASSSRPSRRCRSRSAAPALAGFRRWPSTRPSTPAASRCASGRRDGRPAGAAASPVDRVAGSALHALDRTWARHEDLLATPASTSTCARWPGNLASSRGRCRRTIDPARGPSRTPRFLKQTGGQRADATARR